MKSLSIIFFLVFLCILGCRKNNQVNDNQYLKATIIQTANIDCHLPMLDFSEDSSAIRKLTNRTAVFFVVANMPSSLIVQNKKLYVSARNLQPEEEFPCTMLGPGFPHLKILDAKER